MSLPEPVPVSEEMCPNCGGWFNSLKDETGWCAACTLQASPNQSSCTTCGGLFPKSAQVSKCWACRKEAYLTLHADAIEAYLAWGYSFTAALRLVADDIRPNCQCCGNPIKGGREGVKFCHTSKECRKASEAYTRMKNEGLSPDVALAIASGRVTVLDSITQ
jgi:hypothetical protein